MSLGQSDLEAYRNKLSDGVVVGDNETVGEQEELDEDVPETEGPTGSSNFITWVPSPTAAIWTKLPHGMVPEDKSFGGIVMDDDILAERQARFHKLVTTFITLLKTWLTKSKAFEPGCDWGKMPVTMFVAGFLLNSDESFLVRTICSAVLAQFQYVIMDPDFIPEMLLKLPRISRKDHAWGCYMNMHTNDQGVIKSWYTGSATAFGVSGEKASGLIGRLLSYFKSGPRNAENHTPHERWLYGINKQGHSPNFRKVADFEDLSHLHRIYCFVVESLIMSLTSYDEAYKVHSGGLFWAAAGMPEWIKAFRQQMGIRVFTDVEGLNHGFPLKQGVPADKRFSSTASRRCRNPVANCTVTTSNKWRPVESGHMLSTNVICNACYIWRYTHGTHRPQEAIDNWQRHRDQEDNLNCFWCLETFPLTGHSRQNYVKPLNAKLCRKCYEDRRTHKTMIPRLNVQISADHVFECFNCSVTQALKWFFEVRDGYVGRLHCEKCHYTDPKIVKRNGDREWQKIKDNTSLSLHSLQQEDVAVRQIAGFLAHCHENFGMKLSKGNTQDVNDKEMLRIRSEVVSAQEIAAMNGAKKRKAVSEATSSKGKSSAVTTEHDDANTMEDTLVDDTVNESTVVAEDSDVEYMDTQPCKRAKVEDVKGKGKGKARK